MTEVTIQRFDIKIKELDFSKKQDTSLNLTDTYPNI